MFTQNPAFLTKEMLRQPQIIHLPSCQPCQSCEGAQGFGVLV